MFTLHELKQTIKISGDTSPDIALTSCLCKTMERIVNSKLTWYIELQMVITEFQSGFRRHRSTVDNLVTLEISIRDAFVCRKHLVSIFLFGEGI